MLSPVPETPLQLIKCGCSMSFMRNISVKYKANHLYCTDLCFCGAEEDSCKIMPVINMLMTFEQLFSCGFRYFFRPVSTRMPYCPILTFEDDSTYKHAKDKSDCDSFYCPCCRSTMRITCRGIYPYFHITNY